MKNQFQPQQALAIETDIQQKIERKSNSWLFWTLCIFLVPLSIVRYKSPKIINEIFTVFYNANLAHQIFREREGRRSIPGFILDLNYVLVTGTLAYLILKMWFFQNQMPAYFQMIVVIAVFIGIYLSRLLSLNLLGWIFKASEHARLYIFYLLSFNKLMGILLIPFIFLISFGQASFTKSYTIAAISVFLVLNLLKFIRCLIVGNNLFRFRRFHFFLYICTFEISPVAVLTKLIFLTISINPI